MYTILYSCSCWFAPQYTFNTMLPCICYVFVFKLHINYTMHKAALYESLQGCSLQTQKDICFTLYTRIGSSGTPFIMVNDQQCPVCPVGKQQTPLFKTVEQTARRICSLITIKRNVKKNDCTILSAHNGAICGMCIIGRLSPSPLAPNAINRLTDFSLSLSFSSRWIIKKDTPGTGHIMRTGAR